MSTTVAAAWVVLGAVMPQYRQLADLFHRLGVVIGSSLPAEDVLAVVTAAGVQAIEGAEHAAVTDGAGDGRFRTVAATGELPVRVDLIQYELGSGPCVDPALEDGALLTNDLRTDGRWPEFAARAVAETGVLSMMSFRMFFEDGDRQAGLNLYSTEADAFDDAAETTGLVLATHAALAYSGAMRLRRIENLERALDTNREIGMAMGILMTRHLATQEQAFDLLRVASQHGHRKLADVAQGVIETGDLEYPVPHARGTRPSGPRNRRVLDHGTRT